MEATQWLIDGFEQAGYTQLQAKFCDCFFTKDGYGIECYKVKVKGSYCYLIYATIDYCTVTAIEAKLFDSIDFGPIKQYITEIEPRLEQLLACL